MTIEDRLRILPDKPGVYLMKDASEIIIYVGKAKSLKKRVRQYFRQGGGHSVRTKKMLEFIASFDYIVTDSEVEALILELNLIKRFRPRYNTLLKDDKTYPYIRVTLNEAYPRLIFTREIQNDKSRYFGPYTSAGATKKLINYIQKKWHLCTKNRASMADKKPCFNNYLGICDGLCIGEITSQDHRKKIEEILDFLNGGFKKFIPEIEQEMEEAAAKLDYEKAIEARDIIHLLRKIEERQKMMTPSEKDMDVVGIYAEGDSALAQIFFIRLGTMIGKESISIENKEKLEDMSIADLVEEFIKQFYSGTPYIPSEIIIQEHFDDEELLISWLKKIRGRSVKIRVPQRGDKKKLVDLAIKNAELGLRQISQQIYQRELKSKEILEKLGDMIGMKEPINRIEAYDISNLSGFNAVGSMVVFEMGVPKRSDYRKFRIREAKASDDYGSLREVLRRRFKRGLKEQKEILENTNARETGFYKLPDIILIDGGKGQESVATSVLSEMGLDIVVCGMVKDDRHRTSDLIYKGKPLNIQENKGLFQLVTAIQDEAHRFAIDYHRKLRNREQTGSILDNIEGVGKVRRKNLLKHFGSIDKIKKASLKDLMEVETINKKVAESIYRYFHSK